MRVLLIVLLLLPLTALAHKPSDSYLRLDVEGQTIEGRWDIALRDLEVALGLDANTDGALTWGEVRARHAAIAAYALARLTLYADEMPCRLSAGQQRIDRHSDGAYTVLDLKAACPKAPAALGVDYRLLFDLDTLHRGLVRINHNGHAVAAVIGPDSGLERFSLTEAPSAWQRSWRALGAYFPEGVWHIWIGIDHVLFLISLLLPAVLVREYATWPVTWRGVSRFSTAFIDVLKVVTAFTLAHSITLSLAVLGWISLPSQWVEAAIALSVLLVALNNLQPFLPGSRWAIAFAFGLVHGLGFASVLAGLGLPTGALVPALVGFNLGVEAGQIAVVGIFLPVAFWLRGAVIYRVWGYRLGSLAIAGIALLWLIERLGVYPA